MCRSDIYNEIPRETNMHLDLPKGAKWFLKGVIHHPLGFNSHHLEGAGRRKRYLDKKCFFRITPQKMIMFDLGQRWNQNDTIEFFQPILVETK